ncbi:hypothetical protein [Brevibacillus sp. NRS-1366]|uniref:hypothetical protein n=1 Tax=Brevibacillus sp. NRS-1366 TaxID=3233899 RepID=UPI003D1D1763
MYYIFMRSYPDSYLYKVSKWNDEVKEAMERGTSYFEIKMVFQNPEYIAEYVDSIEGVIANLELELNYGWYENQKEKEKIERYIEILKECR